ncbi:MAG: hypothetical protein DMG39_15110 [Acidobacteria bacterium]|nr:MAG: hypothetical protein DMG39_15110 [Acidobacteriota bacterium]
MGNRARKTSTIPGLPGGLTNYNMNDQPAPDTYDANGNTMASNGLGYVYDFENRVMRAGAGITMAYDGDGNRNRVRKTVAGVTQKQVERKEAGGVPPTANGSQGSKVPLRRSEQIMDQWS